jgi:16S rRNA (guanine966-N2)-methyltransferase
VTRIVAGVWGGRRLKISPGPVRPTTERVREAVANRLQHEFGSFEGRSVLDLYAGSGAMGLELLSRGADRALFVERDARTAAVLRRNAAALAATAATVLVADAAALGRGACGTGFDIVFADPPYDIAPERIAGVLAASAEAGCLAAGCVVVVETARRAVGTPWPPGIDAVDRRDYGDTRVWYGRVNLEPSSRRGG